MRNPALRSLVMLELRRVERPLRKTLGLAAGAAIAITVLGLDIEKKGQPSKWVTLRALRVLKAAYPEKR